MFCLNYWIASLPIYDTSNVANCAASYSTSADGLVVVEEADARCLVNDANIQFKDTVHLISITITGVCTVLNLILLAVIFRRANA